MIDRFQRRFDLGGCDGRHLRDHGRRLFDQDSPRSYCERRSKNSYDNKKSISLVSSLATKCDEHDFPESVMKRRAKFHGGKVANFCSSTHGHMLVTTPKKMPHAADPTNSASRPKANKNAMKMDQRFAAASDTGHFMVVMHYAVKSRQEFFHRACASVWSHKYFQCEDCNPESYFDLTATFMNNFPDTRMGAFSAKMAQRLEESDVGASCDARPNLLSLDDYRECFRRIKKSLKRL